MHIIHTYKKILALVIFYSATAPKKRKKAPPALPRCGADLPSTTAVPHATERRQPTTQYLPTYDTLPFRRFSSLRRQHHKPTRILPSPVVALYLLQVQNKAPNVFATSQHGRVCDLFRVAHVGVTAQGCASEREIKSFNSFSAQGPESSRMPESSHPCAIKIKVRNHLKIDRTGVR